jgi:hypothetical protein
MHARTHARTQTQKASVQTHKPARTRTHQGARTRNARQELREEQAEYLAMSDFIAPKVRALAINQSLRVCLSDQSVSTAP